MGSQPNWMTWTGRVISALPVFGLLLSAYFKFQAVTPEVAKGLEGIGWKESQLPGLGILEIACTIIYAIPQTAVLGAILLTGYMGGAIATHVRVGEGVIPHIIIGVLVWLGLFLRAAAGDTAVAHDAAASIDLQTVTVTQTRGLHAR